MSGPAPSATCNLGGWIGPWERPLMAWLSAPSGGVGESGVLLLAPVGYPYWSSHRTLRALAERLAADGHAALRLDYDATGDSAGGQWEPGRLDAWRAGAAIAAQALRDLGCVRLTVVGVQIGAALALLDGAALEADAIVGWEPVVSGRRYVRQARLLSTPVPEGALPQAGAGGHLVAAGTALAAETIAALGALDLTQLQAAPAGRVLLVGDGALAAAAGRLRELGCAVDEERWPGGEAALEQPAEYATVPDEIVEGIVSWVGAEGAGARSSGPLVGGGEVSTPASGEDSTAASEERPARRAAEVMRPEASFAWESGEVRERLRELTSAHLAGIESEPAGGVGDLGTTVVFLSSGSEPHIGPGRAWVEYARTLALRGHRCLRIDFRGWGESPDDGHAPGRPYDAHCVQDTIAILRALHEQDDRDVVLVGLCASAWVALRAVLSEPAEGVIALNPQLYWQPGDPVEATMQETRTRRAPQRMRERRGARLRIWDALDALGGRPWAARWLDELSRAQTPVALAFAEGDDGIEYLQTRLARRLRRAEATRRVHVLTIPEIDHSMHRSWLRPLVVELLDEQARALTGR